MERRYEEKFEEARQDAIFSGFFPLVSLKDGQMYVAKRNDNYTKTEKVGDKFVVTECGPRYHVYPYVRKVNDVRIVTPEEYEKEYVLLVAEDGSDWTERLYEKYNRASVAAEVDKMIAEAKEYKANNPYLGYKKWKIVDIFDRLSIFDWWNDYLSVSQLKQMKSFLRIAGEFGFNGYVCFKVGASGCSHGMWASKYRTENGYSPDKGDTLFHSFRSGDNYFDLVYEGGGLASDKLGKHGLTYDEVKELLEEQK